MSLNNEIAGVTGRRPEGCVVRVGRKGDRGFPVDRDRFFIAVTTQNAAGVRPLHPDFVAFNNAPKDRASSLTMQLVHADRESCFESSLRAQVDPIQNKSVPSMRPWCVGDGIRAERWDWSMGEYKNIQCPNEHCQFRRPGSGARGSKACKPQARLFARIVWNEGDFVVTKPDGTESIRSVQSTMPSMYARFSTNSWNTAAYLQGYFDYWDQVAADLTKLGANLVDYIEDYAEDGTLVRKVTARRYSLIGARFRLTLQEKSDKDPKTGEKRRYPVVTIAPIDDPWEHLRLQVERMAQLRAQSQEAFALLAEAKTAREQTIDYLDNEVGSHTDGAE